MHPSQKKGLITNEKTPIYLKFADGKKNQKERKKKESKPEPSLDFFPKLFFNVQWHEF